ncbi:MAG: sensor domain-containing diguanylate cyclase [Cyanobacteria bacterium P01_E01_bin.34]
MITSEIGSARLPDPFHWQEPWIPLILAAHGSVLLLATSGTPIQWGIVITTALLGGLGLGRCKAAVWETRTRRIGVFACAWLMMVSHTGVNSFFFLWLVVLTVTYPLLVPLKEGRWLPLLAACSYWALIPFSTSFPPRIVLINKFFHLNIIGYLTYLLAGLRARAVIQLWHTERALREKDRHYRLLAEHTSDLVGLHQSNGRFVYVSPSVKRVLGYEADSLMGQRFADFLAVETDLDPLDPTHRNSTQPYRVRNSSGSIVWLETTLTEIYDAQGQLSLIQSTSRNVSERVAVELQLRHYALHDSLTQLPNRRCFIERFEQEVAESHRQPDYGFALLHIDLDSFKEVNDCWGHASGDRLLEQVAERITSCIRDSDTVARIGGDEFIILMVPVDSVERVETVASRVLSELERPIELANGHHITIGASIGIVMNSEHYEDPQDLIRYADTAMYRAKQAGKSQFATYLSQDMHHPKKRMTIGNCEQQDGSNLELSTPGLADRARNDCCDCLAVEDKPEVKLKSS